MSRCPSAAATGKPACIEPATGKRLAACVDHAQSAPVCRPFTASPSPTCFRHRHIPQLISGVHSSIDCTELNHGHRISKYFFVVSSLFPSPYPSAVIKAWFLDRQPSCLFRTHSVDILRRRMKQYLHSHRIPSYDKSSVKSMVI